MANGEQLLELFQNHYQEDIQRSQSMSFLRYYGELLRRERPFPARNAPDLLYQALTVLPRRRNSAGYFEYPYFTEGEDDSAFYGAPRAIDQMMSFLEAYATLGSRDKIILLIAPSGAGKSTLIDLTVNGLERYTHEQTTTFALRGCPINEDPLHLLDPESRKKLQDEYGVAIKGELCPDCEERKEERKEEWLKSGMKDDFPFEVEPLRLSSKRGKGITRLESKLTQSEAPNKQEDIEKIIKGSNRGILYLHEFGLHGVAFISELNDLIRGGTLIQNGRRFNLDHVIISDTTTAEWEMFKPKASQALLERIFPVSIRYPLIRSDEVKIYEKRVRDLINPPHYSPRIWPVAAEFASITRYKDYKTEDKRGIVTPLRKIDWYDGQGIEGFKQNDRFQVEVQSWDAGEGLEGISPQTMLTIIDGVISAEISHRNPGCVTPLDVIRDLKKYINADSAISSIELRSQRLGLLQEIEERYDKWLIEKVKEAFQDNFPRRATEFLTRYLDQCELFLTERKQKNPYAVNGEEEWIGADEDLLMKFEVQAKPGMVTDEEIRNFRKAAHQVPNDVLKKENRPAVYTDFSVEIQKGLKDMLAEGTGDPEEVLMAKPRNEKQIEKINEVVQRLISEHGFCEKCAPTLVEHVADLLRRRANAASSNLKVA